MFSRYQAWRRNIESNHTFLNALLENCFAFIAMAIFVVGIVAALVIGFYLKGYEVNVTIPTWLVNLRDWMWLR